MILEHNLKSSRSSEELGLHWKKQKKRSSQPLQGGAGQDRAWVTGGEGGAWPYEWQLGEDLAKGLLLKILIRKVYHLYSILLLSLHVAY